MSLCPRLVFCPQHGPYLLSLFQLPLISWSVAFPPTQDLNYGEALPGLSLCLSLVSAPPPFFFPSSPFLPPFFYMTIPYLTPTGSLAWIFHSTRVCISTPRRVRIYLPSVGSNLSPSPNDFASIIKLNVFISDYTGFRTSEQAHGGQKFRRNCCFWRGCSTSLYFQQQATSVSPTICRRCASLTSSRHDGYG
jgi:hypothetical protein